MKKEWLLLVGTSIVTLLIALGIVRWLAPQLLGGPVDLQLVGVDEKVPPFFEGVFRRADYASKEFLLKDPYTQLRAKPLFPGSGPMGPHDILGFRNRHIPDAADIVFIGDSQTYGNNVPLEENYPSQVSRMLTDKQAVPYGMAVGAWGAVQYFDMFIKAILFRPRVVVIGLYTGNDPLDSFKMAYGVDEWKQFIPDHSLSASDMPTVDFPAPDSQRWKVVFKDGVETEFTPTLRLSSNSDHSAVKAGYQVMAKVAEVIAEASKAFYLQPVFIIIPTKELVYAKKVEQEGLSPPEDYRTLVEREAANIDWLAEQIKADPGAVYVDVVSPMQEAALSSTPLYPTNINGHPVEAGYGIIAKAIATAIEQYLKPRPKGLYGLPVSDNRVMLMLVKKEGVFPFKSVDIAVENGWKPGRINEISLRDMANLPRYRVIDTVAPERFGPDSVR